MKYDIWDGLHSTRLAGMIKSTNSHILPLCLFCLFSLLLCDLQYLGVTVYFPVSFDYM